MQKYEGKGLKKTQFSVSVDVVVGDNQAKTGQTIVVLNMGNNTGALPLDDIDDATTEGDSVGACEEGELPDGMLSTNELFPALVIVMGPR